MCFSSSSKIGGWRSYRCQASGYLTISKEEEEESNKKKRTDELIDGCARFGLRQNELGHSLASADFKLFFAFKFAEIFRLTFPRKMP
jgi:hypothetical protein